MGFFSKKNKVSKSPENEPINTPAPAINQAIAEGLYKQNYELAEKNKTLSLLRHLYQISISNLNPSQIASEITEVIEYIKEYKYVGIFTLDNTEAGASQKTPYLRLLGSSTEESLKEFLKKNNLNFTDSFPDIMSLRADYFFSKIILNKAMFVETNLSKVFPDIKKNIAEQISTSGHIKNILGYPLIVDGNLTGILVIMISRIYDGLPQYEKESTASLADVIAVATEKSLLTEKLKQTNLDLKNTNDAMAELLKQKTEMVAFATHQLRSPLTSVRGIGSMIIEGEYGPVEGDMKEGVWMMYKSASDLVGVVNDFLTSSKLELNNLKYDLSEFSVKELAIEVVKQSLHLIFHPDILKLNYSFESPDDPYTILADAGKVKQIFSNIIDNAVKYTKSGSINVYIERMTRDMEKKVSTPSKDTILISVKDTGEGIPEQVMPKLFKKFSRAENASELNINGNGLGLYIVKELVEGGGGKVWAESEGKGKGTQFYIELPVKAVVRPKFESKILPKVE